MVQEMVSDIDQLNWPTLVLSAGLLALALSVRRFFPVFPASLAVLAAALLVARFVDLESYDIAVVGDVQGACPLSSGPTWGRRSSSTSSCPRRHSPSSHSPT